MAFGAVNYLTGDKNGNDDRISDLLHMKHLQVYGVGIYSSTG
jgi:hypothetical protein